MRGFIGGVALGLFVGASAAAWASSFYGGNGYLHGWSVTTGGHEVCSSPFVWVNIHEIECD